MNKKKTRVFEQKKVVIIGATGGLGEAYTKMFLEEGAKVYLGIRSEAKLSKEVREKIQEGQATHGILDVQDVSAIEAFSKEVSDAFGQIDYVINAIGYDVRKELSEHSNEEIQKSIDINLTAAIYLTKYFLPILKDQKGSTIVHMGGFVDGALAFPFYSADVASRAGMFSFCESMNRELKQLQEQCHVTYFCPNPASTKAEEPYHPIWKEMKTRIDSVEKVAMVLKKTIIKQKKVSIMGGHLQSGFSNLNHISTKLSNLLLMNNYTKILHKYLGTKNEDVKKKRDK